MSVLIAGFPEHTRRYQEALHACHADFKVSLSAQPDDLSQFDQLLLPGGGDMDPSYFHQPNLGSKNIDQELDQKQFTILHAFVLAHKPILGICRGMQLINVYFGGTLLQHLPSASIHSHSCHDQFHPVTAVPDSVLFRLYGSTIIVNSAHHQGCQIIGRALQITQQSPDQVPEALEHQTLPILGVQWHPERVTSIDGLKLIRYFLALSQFDPLLPGYPSVLHQ